ncbi:hypothetical protein QTP88_002527 [Uroleucon formosanum]
MLKNIPDSQGTIAFLKVMNDTLLSFLDKSITFEDRTYKICSQACKEIFRTARSMTSTYSTMINFSMNDILKRLTRIQLLNSIQNDLHENQKAIIINELKNNNTIESSVSNFSQSDKFNFPRLEKHDRNFINSTKVQKNIYSVESMSDDVIDSILAKSLRNAKEMATNLGIQIYEDFLLRPQYLSNAVLQNVNEDLDELKDELMDENLSSSVSMTVSIVYDISEDTFKDLSNISEFGDFGSGLNLKDFSISDKLLKTLYLNQKKNLGSDNINSQTEFVNVSLDEDSMTVVKKSSLYWLFNNKNKKVSNDRLQRFINNKPGKNYNTNKRNKQKVPSHKDKSKSIYKKQKTKVFFQDSEDSDVELKLCVNGPDNNDVVLLDSKELQVTNTEKEYKKPSWNDIKPEVYLSVRFKGYNKKPRREETKFQYVCCVIQVETDEDDGITQVQGMANEKTKKNISL